MAETASRYSDLPGGDLVESGLADLANGRESVELPGWRDRSRLIDRVGTVDFFHYDFYSQALSKIARGIEKDHKDVRAMIERGLVEPAKAWQLFRQIDAQLYRHPNIDPDTFRKAVESSLGPG